MHEITAQDYFAWYEYWLETPFGPSISNFYGAQIAHTMAKLWAKKAPGLEAFHPRVKPKKSQTVEQMKGAISSIVAQFKGNK